MFVMSSVRLLAGRHTGHGLAGVPGSLVGLVALLLATVLPVSTERLLPVVECKPCAIDVRLAATLSHDRGVDFLSHVSIPLVRQESGRYITTNAARTSIVVFDRLGLLMAELGGFQSVTRLLTLREGKVGVYDGRARMLSELDRRGQLSPGRPFPQHPTAELPTGMYLGTTLLADPKSVGQPFHVIGRDGELIRSFGESAAPFRAVDRPLVQRRVAVTKEGTILAAPAGRYVLERWDPAAGRKVSETPIKQSWFVESSAALNRASEAPPSIIEAVWSETVAWVLVRVADRQSNSPTYLRDRPFEAAEYDRAYDWVVQAVNPGTGEVLAERWFSEAQWPAGPEPSLVSAAERGRRLVRRLLLVQKVN